MKNETHLPGEVLTGRQRIGNNTVDGQIAGQPPGDRIARIITITMHRAVAGKHIFDALRVIATSECDGVIVNLADVPLLDTVGLGALLDCQRRTTGRGAVFAIAEASDSVRRQIEIVYLHKVLRCYATNEAAREVVEMRTLEKSAMERRTRTDKSKTDKSKRK